MESIVETLKQKQALPPGDYYDKLRAAGFQVPPSGYPIITPDAIVEYLTGVADSFLADKKRKAKVLNAWKIVRWDGRVSWVDFGQDCWWDSRIWRACWQECEIAECKMLPPEHILTSIMRAKDHFDKIRIVTVEVKEEAKIPDPLVVGIKQNDLDRYLIDWWGDDIDPTAIGVK